MTKAGFTDVSISVHGFDPAHSGITARLAARIPSLRTGRLAALLEHRAGWYVAARGTRPTTGKRR
jgi:hypothetical protein